MSDLLLSVVIPTRHRTESLAVCLDQLQASVQELSSNYYEVIVMDDGTDTSTPAMIRSDYPWVNWFAGPRRGPAANRNAGVSHASGEWILFTDDDCVPDSDWLNAFMDSAEEGDTLLEGRTVCRMGVPSILYEAPINENGGSLWSCNMAIRRDSFEQSGGFDERFPYASSEDAEFRDRLLKLGHTSRFIKKATIDHPPRKRRFGSNWNTHWKSKVLYEVLSNQTHWNHPTMFLRVAKMRLLELRKPNSLSTFATAMSSLIIESLCVAVNRRSWNRWATELAAQGPLSQNKSS